jgi:hypothetical protein
LERLIALMAPVLDLTLAAGERVSRLTGGEDEYVPIRSAAERIELGGSTRRPLQGEAD